MKNILLTIISSLCLFSCAMPKMGHPVSHKGVTYVKTEDGKVLHPESVKVKTKKIVADDEKIPMSDVQAYCDGKDSFLRVGKGFAVKSMSGDINIYTSTSTYTTTTYSAPSGGMGGGFKTSSHSHTSVYLQAPTSPALLLMNYKNVKSILDPKEPAYDYVHAYERTRRSYRIWGYSSLGLMAGGLATAISVKSTSSASGIGITGFFAGTLSGFSYLITKGLTKQLNLMRAISKHNGMMKD